MCSADPERRAVTSLRTAIDTDERFLADQLVPAMDRSSKHSVNFPHQWRRN
jgi:hypothetical protein